MVMKVIAATLMIDTGIYPRNWTDQHFDEIESWPEFHEFDCPTVIFLVNDPAEATGLIERLEKVFKP